MQNKEVCILLPFFNEAKVLHDVISNLKNKDYYVLGIDDGSNDNSWEIAKNSAMQVLRHPINLGQGSALQTGIDFVRLNPNFKYFVTFDSDGQHKVENIEHVLQPLIEDRADIVFGTRFQDDKTKFPFIKRIILQLAIKYTKLSTGVPLTDTHNGFRALNRKAINQINLSFSGMTHASEFVEKAGRAELRIKEVPVYILYTKYSKSKGQSIWNAINILTDLFLR
ncbi:MAG: glycosyltransferase family 2 protein [Actinomycetes bacterium]